MESIITVTANDLLRHGVAVRINGTSPDGDTRIEIRTRPVDDHERDKTLSDVARLFGHRSAEIVWERYAAKRIGKMLVKAMR